MKNYIWFIIVLAVLLGGWYLISHSQKAQAPTSTTTGGQTSSTTPTPTPTNVGLPLVYNNPKAGFTLHYPTGYTVSDSNLNQVKFTIPPASTNGTNLGTDTNITVEKIPNLTTCTANAFFDSTVQSKTVTDNGVTYSMATMNGAGAGNRYDETVYALVGTKPCIAVHYFIHYSVLDNYPAGTVQGFDEPTLVNTFDQIRRTLVVSK